MILLRCMILSDCQRYRRDCNFTDEEQAVFDLCARGKSRVQISEALRLSVLTVDRRIRSIKDKIQKVQN